MGNEQHREPLFQQQDGQCALCDKPLHTGDLSHMNEVDHIEPDGPDTLENTRLLHRGCHQERHGIESAPTLPALRAAYDNRQFWMKERRRLDKQIQDVDKSAWASDVTTEALAMQLARCEEQEKHWKKRTSEELKALDHPIVDAALAVRGVGEIVVAFLLAYTDIEEASGPRSLMQHLGVGSPDTYWVRKGDGREQREGRHPGKRWMRAELFMMSSGQLMAKGPYRSFYNLSKMRHDFSGTTNGHYAALRETAKEMLKHFWQAYRELEDLPVNEGVLGYSDPRNYGWALE